MQVARFEVGDKVILINDTPIAPEGHIDVISRIVQGLQPQPLITLEGLPESFVYEHEIALLRHVEQKLEGQKVDAINSPKHYSVFDGVEAIEIIASSLTQAEFRGYCFGNLLKYRLRVGKKDNIEQELGKADKYQELFDKFKHLCKEGE